MNYLNTMGRIFDIQRYSIHDGPGIRTIIFLKGCVLRCRWCCNPESQRYDFDTRTVDGKTITVGKDVTVSEIMKTVESDRPYYYRSNGGLTLSGGECLCQPEFARSLLQASQESGINTAIESMACVEWDVIASVLPYLDTYLLDIKHMNSEKHRLFTGKGNELMLENAMKIAKSNQTDLIVRVPVIPTFNDTADEIAQIAKFAATLPGVKQIHLLPYHRLGQDKYEQIGRTYTMQNILPLEPAHMEMLQQVVQSTTNLICQIGG